MNKLTLSNLYFSLLRCIDRQESFQVQCLTSSKHHKASWVSNHQSIGQNCTRVVLRSFFFFLSFSSGNMYVTTRFETPKSTQHLTSGQNRSTRLKTAAFVPPFRKNTVTEMQKNTDLDVNKTSATEFALPFPKQKTIVQEDSSKPQEEQNKHLERNTFIPPTKKINTENVADDERHEESNVRTLHVNHNLMNHSGSEGCGPQPSASSPSKKENMLSMNQGAANFGNNLLMVLFKYPNTCIIFFFWFCRYVTES